MVKITLPATTANFGIGFDTLGMSLNLYNTFSFKERNSYQIIGFDDFVTIENNLVLSSYSKFAETYLDKSSVVSVEIEQLQAQVPFSRGLGSSAACILAGVLAANIINKIGKSYDECVNFAARIEGHPDNVFACAYGGFISAYYYDNKYYVEQYPISDLLGFKLLIPRVLGNTKELRNVLPKTLVYPDVVHNLSRIISLPKALKDGDFGTLKRILIDRLHEPYRITHIPKSCLIQELNKRQNLIALISGSGPTVLLVFPQEFSPIIGDEILKDYQLVDVVIGDKIEIEVE